MSAANELKVRRVLEFVRALTNYIDDVIGHGPHKAQGSLIRDPYTPK